MRLGAQRIMNDLYPLLALPGLMAGLQVWTRIVRLILWATGITSTTNSAPAVRVSARTQLLLLASLVGAWLLIFVGLTSYVYGHAVSPGWSWFFGGVAATPAAIFPSGLALWLRRRRAAAK